MVAFRLPQSEVALLFTLVFVVMPLSMLVAGRIQDMQGPRGPLFVAGLVYGASWFFVGFANSFLSLYIIYGVLGGAGLGAVYSCTTVTTVKWFPDKRGFAAGIISARFSGGPILLAPLAVELIKSYGVLATCTIYGVAFAVVICLAAVFSVSPPPGYTPDGWSSSIPCTPGIGSAREVAWREMLRDAMFWVLWVMLVLLSISGLMVIAHAAVIGQEVVHLTAERAGAAVGVLALANAPGRVFWGWVSDIIGRYPAMALMFVVSGAAMFSLGSAASFAFFVTVIAAVAFCYGGFFAVCLSVIGDLFGTKNLGINWGLMFTGFAPAAVIGPLLAAKVKEYGNGDYSVAFLVAGGLSFLGALLTLYSMNRMKKRHSAATL